MFSDRQVLERRLLQHIAGIDLVRPELDWMAARDLSGDDRISFFRDHWQKLLHDIFELAHDHFSTRLSLDDENPWMNWFPLAFYNYVDAVAHPDPHAGHWRSLLSGNYERAILIGAIILKFIDRHVLSQNLYGTDHDLEGDMLLTENLSPLRDQAWQNACAKDIRDRRNLHSVEDGIPPLFWSKTDELAMQISIMLLPLFGLVHKPDARVTAEFQSFYKRIHGIISMAGWINVAAYVRLVIIWTTWTTPGEVWNQGQEPESMWSDGYETARYVTTKVDEQRGQRHHRTPRVKISAQPSMTLVMGRIDGKSGYECVNIQEAQAVYYHGLLDVNDHLAQYISLNHYLPAIQQLFEAPKLKNKTKLLLLCLCAFAFINMVVRSICVSPESRH